MPREACIRAAPPRAGAAGGRRSRPALPGALLGLGVALLVCCDTGPDPAAPGPRPAEDAADATSPLGDADADATSSLEARDADATSSLEATSELGRYRIAARPVAPPVPLHRMHDWIVRVDLLEGASGIPTSIRFDGGMPSHGHGFATRPRVTRNLGGGEFLVEGVKFHMPGAWVLRITVTSRAGSDHVELPLAIGP